MRQIFDPSVGAVPIGLEKSFKTDHVKESI